MPVQAGIADQGLLGEDDSLMLRQSVGRGTEAHVGSVVDRCRECRPLGNVVEFRAYGCRARMLEPWVL